MADIDDKAKQMWDRVTTNRDDDMQDDDTGMAQQGQQDDDMRNDDTGMWDDTPEMNPDR